MKRPIILVRRLINVSRTATPIFFPSFFLPLYLFRPLSILSPLPYPSTDQLSFDSRRPSNFKNIYIKIISLDIVVEGHASFFFSCSFFFGRQSGKDARSISDSPLMDELRSSGEGGFNKSTSIVPSLEIDGRCLRRENKSRKTQVSVKSCRGDQHRSFDVLPSIRSIVPDTRRRMDDARGSSSRASFPLSHPAK